jgi:hypothetical protein
MYIENSEAMIHGSLIRLMLHRLALIFTLGINSQRIHD